MATNTAVLPVRVTTPARIDEPNRRAFSEPVVLGLIAAVAAVDRVASIFVRRPAAVTTVVALPISQHAAQQTELAA